MNSRICYNNELSRKDLQDRRQITRVLYSKIRSLQAQLQWAIILWYGMVLKAQNQILMSYNKAVLTQEDVSNSLNCCHNDENGC